MNKFSFDVRFEVDGNDEREAFKTLYDALEQRVCGWLLSAQASAHMTSIVPAPNATPMTDDELVDAWRKGELVVGDGDMLTHARLMKVLVTHRIGVLDPEDRDG